jgi:AcrR family transcriptional regulator
VTQPVLTRAERLRTQLREEIVGAAAEAFAQQGYHRTGMADIARIVGIGQSSLYGQFPSKRALLDAVVDDGMGRVLALLIAENGPEAAETFDAYREQATRIAGSFANILEEDPTMVRLLRTLLVEARGVDDELAEKADAFTDAAAQVTGAYLHHGVELGYLRADLDVDATARVVNWLIISVALEQDRRGSSREESQRLVDATLRLYLDGIGARP